MNVDFTAFLTDSYFAGNPIWRYVVFFFVILAALIAGKVVQILLKRTARSLEARQQRIGAVALTALAPTMMFLFFSIGLKIGLNTLVMAPRIEEFSRSVTSVLVTLSIGYMAYMLVDIVDHLMGRVASNTDSKIDDVLAPMIRKSLRITVVVLVLLQVATVLSDKPVTSIIAGLGIGGLAVALAAQDTLKNVFGSMVILGDKPFELGDRVVVDGHDGPVESVGFRSTKIRTFEGALVTVPNGELANKTIQNIGKRPYIRRIADISITYGTPPEKVDRAIEILKELLDQHEGLNPDLPPRVHFNEFEESSLNIRMIYWYHPPNFWDYMAFTERLNKEILHRFNAEGIEFAFPTQTLHLVGGEDQLSKAGKRG